MKKFDQFLGQNIFSEKKVLGLTLNSVMPTIPKIVKHTKKHTKI